MTEQDVKPVVDFVFDVICAHSYVGFARFQRALARRVDAGGQATVRYLPFELAPNAPTDGMPLLTALALTFGDGAVAYTGQFAVHAAKDGLALNYDIAIATGTFEAHRLIAAAAGQGLGAAMTERLFRAHFTDGLNVGDEAVLARLADEIGVVGPWPSRQSLRAELDRVRGLGIGGVPVFIMDGGDVLAGSQPESAYHDALAVSVPPEAGPA